MGLKAKGGKSHQGRGVFNSQILVRKPRGENNALVLANGGHSEIVWRLIA